MIMIADWIRSHGVSIGTANRGYAQYAQEEIRRLIPGAKFAPLQPGELFIIDTPMSAQQCADLLRQQEPIFLRHLQPAYLQLPLQRTDDDLKMLDKLLPAENWPFHHGSKVAVQVRKADAVSANYASQDVKRLLDDWFTAMYGTEAVVRGADFIVSVLLAGDRLYIGASSPADNLSDWAGGAIRFRREEEQVSRSKFKLLEAEQRFGLDFSGYRNAVDIGAAPGGWSSLLLERGVRVTAVDPGQMNPSILADPKFTFLRHNAADVKFAPDQFDLLVCDMSWNPKQMARLLADLLYALRTGGTAIITVKLMHKKPFQTVRDVLETLSVGLMLQRAKQLFHNRDELTLFLLKR